jgi:isoleucyl-tRNA synthetase
MNFTKADLERIPENINFSQEEGNVLSYWNAEKVFENCLKQSKGKPRYVAQNKCTQKVMMQFI